MKERGPRVEFLNTNDDTSEYDFRSFHLRIGEEVPPEGCACARGVSSAVHALAQGARVTPLIVETTCAISPRACAFIAYLARRARGSRARDGTMYGRLRASPTSFFVHHTQRLSKAAACGNVDGIHKMIQVAKQSAAVRDRGAQERDA